VGYADAHPQRPLPPFALTLVAGALAAGCGGAAFTSALDVAGDASDARSSTDLDSSQVDSTWDESSRLDSATPADAGDDLAADLDAVAAAADTSLQLGPDGCPLVTHANGLGGTWTDCTALGTYDVEEARRAAASALPEGPFQAGACGALAIICAVEPPNYPCWVYGIVSSAATTNGGPGAGHVITATNDCVPSPKDPVWE
jgi:hypothetical protein